MLNTLLKLKKMAKKGITGMRALGFIFLGLPNLRFGGLKKFFFYENREFELICFLVYPFYGSLFF